MGSHSSRLAGLCAGPVPPAGLHYCLGAYMCQATAGNSSYHLPGSSRSVSWVCSRSTISGVLCVSSGELTSGCGSPGGC